MTTTECSICMESKKCISPRDYESVPQVSWCSHYACVDCWNKNNSGKCFFCRGGLPKNFPPKSYLFTYTAFIFLYLIYWYSIFVFSYTKK